MKVGLVIKRSQWSIQLEERKDPRLRRLVEAHDDSIGPLKASHEAHEKTIREVEDALVKLGAEVAFKKRAGETFDATGLDLVISIGGDGTLLAASHFVTHTPILGINSAPLHSVGFFCGAKSPEVPTFLSRALKGQLKKTELTRMRVRVNGADAAARVLNDALLCHASPAATSRYVIRLGEIEEQQKSSGFWIGPAAGSTAAQRSAGGRVLPLTSRRLQLVVREPYTPTGEAYLLRHALIEPGQVLVVRSKIHDAKLFFDGPDNALDLGYGDTIEFTQAEEPLVLLGIASKRKWGARSDHP